MNDMHKIIGAAFIGASLVLALIGVLVALNGG